MNYMTYKELTLATTLIVASSVSAIPMGDFQNKIVDLSGLNAINSVPQLETTDQRNQFFDNYSVLSIPDIQAIDQVQLEGIQTFAPSYKKVSLDGLDKIKGITSGLAMQDIAITPEDLKGIKIQDGKITIPDMANKGQQVKDIVSAANAVMQEVKSLNQKELGSLKLTITDIKNIQSVVPMIQQQLMDRPMVKGEDANGISVDTTAMNTDLDSMGREMNALMPKLTFADYAQLVNMGTSKSGEPTMPNYNKETASDNINRFVELLDQQSKYIEAGAVFPPVSAAPPTVSSMFDYMPGTTVCTFGNQCVPYTGPPMKDSNISTIKGKSNGFLQIDPDMYPVTKGFTYPVLPLTQFVWAHPEPRYTANYATMNLSNGFQPMYSANLSNLNGSSEFEYMGDTSFETFSDFQAVSPNSLYFNDYNANLLNNNLTGLCVGACQQKLAYGDLVGALDEIKNNLPESVVLK
jgi:hypothetical protein